MSVLLQYEKNIEDQISAYLTSSDLPAFTSRGVFDLGINNIQIGLQYVGAVEGMRQNLNGFQEYDLHEGELMVVISTSREQGNEHHKRMGLVRSLLLNGRVKTAVPQYTIFDLAPQMVTHVEDDENNLDQTTLSYSIKWKVDMTNL